MFSTAAFAAAGCVLRADLGVVADICGISVLCSEAAPRTGICAEEGGCVGVLLARLSAPSVAAATEVGKVGGVAEEEGVDAVATAAAFTVGSVVTTAGCGGAVGTDATVAVGAGGGATTAAGDEI